jgi:hypothetical protein
MAAAKKTEEIEYGVALVAARTDTKWWWDAMMEADGVIFLKGRVVFEGANNGAPFPSALLFYRKVPEFMEHDRVVWYDPSTGIVTLPSHGK